MKKHKSLAKRHSYQDSDKKYFEEVVFLVHATSHEQHQFWVDYHHQPRFDHCRIHKWEQVMSGTMIEIGELDNRPINLAVNWAILEGYRVLFYEAVSQVVDYKMVDEWIEHFSKHIRWDNGHRWAHTDSNNFHLCINAIQDLWKKHGTGTANPRDRRLF